MHAHISIIKSVPFHEHFFEIPILYEDFVGAYNLSHIRRDRYGFYALTFIGTSTFLHRRDKECARGAISNALEASVISNFTYRLVHHFSFIEDFVNHISFISPYQAQVALLNHEFNDIAEYHKHNTTYYDN